MFSSLAKPRDRSHHAGAEGTGSRRRRRLAVLAGALALAGGVTWPGTAIAHAATGPAQPRLAVAPSDLPLPTGRSESAPPVAHGVGGAVLDGYGGIHPFGGLALDTRAAPYWEGQDIARSLVLRTDGSGGWVLDGHGGVHAFGAASPAPVSALWPGGDIARAMAVVSVDQGGQPDGRQGYILDGYGGLHPWGGAPPLDPGVAWPGWDIARGLDVHLDGDGVPDGGWILDGWGGVHGFGAAPALVAPTPRPERDLYLQLHDAAGVPYAVERWGVVDGMGSQVAATWDGYADWGAWDIARDVVLADAGGGGPQPVSAAAAHALRAHVDRYTIAAPALRQTHSLSCEAAALRVALAARGVQVSEDWIIAAISGDPRPPVLGRGGAVQRWGDPYKSFVGRIDGSEPLHTGYGVYDPPVAAAARAAGRPAVGAEGWDPWALYDEVALGHPAVVWTDTTFSRVAMNHWTSWDGADVPYAIGEHAVTVVGVDAVAGTVTIVDVLEGVRRSFSMSRFEGFFASFGNMAVVVQ